MTYDELMQTICRSSAADWIHIPEAGAHTFRGDLNIHVRRLDLEVDSGVGMDDRAAFVFAKSLTPQAVKMNAKPALYEIRYGNSPVERFVLLTVDGGNACIPAPDPETKQISQRNYRIAKALDYLGTLDNYVKHAGFQVAPAPSGK